MTNPFSDMEKAEVLFCIGTNMTECHPVASTRVKQAIKNGSKLIVADPRKIELAKLADLYLPIKVGSDVALLLAMANVILAEGLIDRQFIQERTTGFEAYQEFIKPFDPSWAWEKTGVSAELIKQAAIWYGQGEPAAIYYTLGITEHQWGVNNVQSLCNLALMTGNLGKSGGGINPLRGQNNVQGAGDSGSLPVFFPGFQKVTDQQARDKFEKLYGRKMAETPGINKINALEKVGDQIRAMIIVGENTVVSDADRHVVEKGLANLDFLVVVDIFPTETSQFADVVLPASSWAETDGSYTNSERRVQRVRAAISPTGETKPDWWIIQQLANRLGITGFDYQSAGEVFDELCSVSPIYQGLSWDRINKESLQWPVEDPNHPGTPILHQDEFKNGKGIFSLIPYHPPAEETSAEYPYWLTTGRRLATYHTHTQTGRAEGIEWLVPNEVLEVHPHDCKTLQLKNGDWVQLISQRGEITIRIQETDRSPQGTFFCSFSFNDAPINYLTGTGYDAVAGTPAYKVTPVQIIKA